MLLIAPAAVLAQGAGPDGQTNVLIAGEIQSLTIDNAADVWSGGTIVINGTSITIPRNLLIDVPAARFTLQQAFESAPAACAGTSGLASADACVTCGGVATILGNRMGDGEVIAGDVFIEKGQETLTGIVTFIDHTDGYLRVNGDGTATSGSMVRVNDPSGRFTVQQGFGCDGVTANCSADERFGVDSDNFTITYSTGYPACIASTVVGGNRSVGANGAGIGDPLCPDSNRGIQPVPNSTRFAPIQIGDPISAEGNVENIGGASFLSAHTMTVADEMNTAPGQPDYIIFDEVEWDVPEFANERIRGLFIGFTTASDQVDLFALEVDPTDNSNNEFIIGTTSSNPDTINQGIPPTSAGIFKIRWDFDFIGGVDDRRGGCAILGNEFGFGATSPCPGGLTPQNELNISAPVTREMIGRTRESVALKALPVPPIVLDISGNQAPFGEYLTPVGSGFPEFGEINLDGLATPLVFGGLRWNLDRRLGPGGCVDLDADGIPDCEATAQPLDPFPFSGTDPRSVLNGTPGITDPDRIFEFWPFGVGNLAPWPPALSGPDPVDTITITRVRWRSRPDLLRVRVVGVVTPGPGLFMPTEVELWIPGQVDGTGTGCTGTLFETTPVDDLVTGAFARTTPKLTFPANPGTVCVRSPNGGAAQEIAIENPN